ncbi:MAG: hypothetical protein ABI068_12235 [Ktedonobacterales bacterium]
MGYNLGKSALHYTGGNAMTHTMTLSDEQFNKLEAASHLLRRTPNQILADLVDTLPMPHQPLLHEEYQRRWDEFFAVVGSIQHGAPLTGEEIDELIGEEAAHTHDFDAAT